MTTSVKSLDCVFRLQRGQVLVEIKIVFSRNLIFSAFLCYLRKQKRSFFSSTTKKSHNVVSDAKIFLAKF